MIAVALGGLDCHPAVATAPAPRVAPPPPPAPEPVARPEAPLPAPYPLPPKQHEPWRARAEIDHAFGEAVAHVFAVGAADPRGCVYREVEIETGDVWSGARATTKTHAWVMPKHGDDDFAVAWSGLVYRVRAVGAPADLRADAEAVLRADRARIDKEKKDNPTWEPHRFDHATPEAMNVSHELLAPMHAAMLARLGEGDLAARMWSAWASKEDAGELLVAHWAWAHFDRAVVAHMAGEDAVAWESTRALGGVAQEIEDAKWPIAELHADTERRLRAKATRAPLEDVLKLPVEQRVPALVDRLEDVAARQWGQPGGVSLGEDPIVRALVDVGPPAALALIDVIEKDTRLTRSVHFWRDFARQRSLLGVHEAAYVAMAGIVEMSFFHPASTGDDLTARGAEGRKKLADELRAYWTKWRDVTKEERWYRVLADDKETHESWLAAASSITQPTNVSVVPGSMVWTTTYTTSGGGPIGLRGEALRAKSAPSVTQLLERRTSDLASEPNSACEVALALAAWDPQASLPTLAKQMQIAVSGASYGCIARVTLARASAGDAGALGEYARFVATTSPRTQDVYGLTNMLEPMRKYPNDRDIEVAARTMFGPGGSWVPLVPATKVNVGAQFYLAELVPTDMLRVAAFREHVEASLSDMHKAGTIKVRDDGGISIEMNAGWQTGTGVLNGEHADPGVRAVRVADYYASELAQRQGAPPFRLYWPESERNRALPAVRAWVRTIR
ncbi:MAG TPA: hypothetical protein VIF62_23605 [Labilithrix sp.]